MNGPEHYREAERLLERAKMIDPAGTTREMLQSSRTIELAQAHATMAQTAALAYNIAVEGHSRVADGWHAIVFDQPFPHLEGHNDRG